MRRLATLVLVAATLLLLAWGCGLRGGWPSPNST